MARETSVLDRDLGGRGNVYTYSCAPETSVLVVFLGGRGNIYTHSCVPLHLFLKAMNIRMVHISYISSLSCGALCHLETMQTPVVVHEG